MTFVTKYVCDLCEEQIERQIERIEFTIEYRVVARVSKSPSNNKRFIFKHYHVDCYNDNRGRLPKVKE